MVPVPFEQTLAGQLLFLLLGGAAGLLVGRTASSAMWLIPLASVPWLGFVGTQVFC
jgi:hypothetical protein